MHENKNRNRTLIDKENKLRNREIIIKTSVFEIINLFTNVILLLRLMKKETY